MVGGVKTRGKILSRTSLTSGESYTAQSGVLLFWNLKGASQSKK